jgi:hypothetical protein
MTILDQFKTLDITTANLSELLDGALTIDWVESIDDDRMSYDVDVVSVTDIICGLFWYCVDNHGDHAQGSIEYKVQSILPYTPDANETGPHDPTTDDITCAQEVYNALMAARLGKNLQDAVAPATARKNTVKDNMEEDDFFPNTGRF